MLEEVYSTSSGNSETAMSDVDVGPPTAHLEFMTTSTRTVNKQPFWGRARRHLVHEFHKLFFAGPGQQSDDHLVEVVQRDPDAACRLIKSLTLLSTLGNVAVSLTCFGFLWLYWKHCGGCDRPLRWWLLIHAVMQMLQLPVRLVLLVYVRAAQAAGESIEPCVVSLTGSPAWRVSKFLALAQYGWLVLGIVWWMHTDSCSYCPGVKKLTLMALLLSVVRACSALIAYNALFETPAVLAEVLTVIAATDAQIDALQLFSFSGCRRGSCGELRAHCEDKRGDKDLEELKQQEDEERQPPAESCSICLSEFLEGAMIRRLPCGHDFHRGCVDTWLKRNKRCPLCVQAIDSGRSFTGKKLH